MAWGQSEALLGGVGREFPLPWTIDADIALGGGRTLRLGELLPGELRNSEAFASLFTGWRVGTPESGYLRGPLLAEADLGAYGILRIEIHATGGIPATAFHPVGADLTTGFLSKVLFAVAETRRLAGKPRFDPRPRRVDRRDGEITTEFWGLTSMDAGPASAFLQLLTSTAPL